MLRKLINASLRNVKVNFNLFNYNLLDTWFMQSAVYDSNAIIKSLQACYNEIEPKLKEAQNDLIYYKSLNKKTKYIKKQIKKLNKKITNLNRRKVSDFLKNADIMYRRSIDQFNLQFFMCLSDKTKLKQADIPLT